MMKTETVCTRTYTRNTLQKKMQKSLVLFLVSVFILSFYPLHHNVDLDEKCAAISAQPLTQETQPVCELKYEILDFKSQENIATFEIEVMIKNADFQEERLTIHVWDVAKKPVYQIVNITLLKSNNLYRGSGIFEARTLGFASLYPFDAYYFALYYQVEEIELEESIVTISEADMHFSLDYYWEIKDSEVRGSGSSWTTLIYLGRRFHIQLYLILPLLMMYFLITATTYLQSKKEPTLSMIIVIHMSSIVFAAAQHLSMPILYVASFYDELMLNIVLINTFFLAYSIAGYVFEKRVKKSLHFCFLTSLLLSGYSAFRAINVYLQASNLVGILLVFTFVTPSIIIIISWINWIRLTSKENAKKEGSGDYE